MKKILLFVGGVLATALFVTPTFAAKFVDTGAYIKDGTILDKFGDVIHLGYNNWGYNYEAHMFNGKYCDAYANASWCQQFKDVSLIMKWNDAWLSNMDRGTQGDDQLAYTSLTTPDQKLDRHYPTNSYVGSGAWLTNHAVGTYESAVKYHWDVTGVWVITVNNGTYPHDYTFTMTSLPDGTFAGIGGYPEGGSYVFDEVVTNGQINGDAISFTASYYQNGLPTGYVWDAIGTIAPNGSMSGTGDAGVSEWHSTLGVATKVMETCTVSDFVKIVAVPTGATKDVNNVWHTSNGAEIGPDVWGSFAIIQEIASDPCGEYGVIDYMSPLRKGLGKW